MDLGKAYTIGITGGSGSGKTTFIRRLREQFSGEQLCVVSQDNYYLPRHHQKQDNQGVTNFDKPKCIDKKAFIADLQQLQAGQPVTREEYVFNNELAVPRVLHFQPAPVIIAEGLFILNHKKIRDLLDLKLFLDAKDNLKVIRRIKRDRIERNYPLEDVLYRYEHHVLPSFEKYILPYRDQADLVINNNAHFEPALQLISGFIRNRLNEVNLLG